MSILMSSIIAWISRTVMFGTIIMYGSLGETVTEKSGNLITEIGGGADGNRTRS